jgi:anthranilate/para-aminobenzoate synthase component II
MRYHSLVVEEASLPLSLRVTAKDQTHGLIMGVQHESLPLYGVQFHPESIGTPEGSQLLWNFLHRC